MRKARQRVCRAFLLRLVRLGRVIALEGLESQPSSDGFPEGLLDQPFYGWVQHRPTPTSSPFQRASDSVSSCCTNEKDAVAPFEI